MSRTTGAAEQSDDDTEEHPASFRPVYHPQRIEAARLVIIYSVFHNECPNFKTLYFCNHEPQMNEARIT